MIVERARMQIQPGAEEAFEQALDRARTIVAQSPGYRSLRVARGVENPSEYLLLIEWDSVEAHMEVFRTSELYEQWAALLRPHYAQPPQVEHFTPIVSQ
jgi:heme-degrading monooxygenase HmoA